MKTFQKGTGQVGHFATRDSILDFFILQQLGKLVSQGFKFRDACPFQARFYLIMVTLKFQDTR